MRVVSRGHVQAMLVPADTRAATDAAPPKGSPAALLRKLQARVLPVISGPSVSDLVIEDRG